MNKKVLPFLVVLSVMYIAYNLAGTIFGSKKSEPHIFELAKLEYVAKWFHSKDIKQIVCSKSLNNSKRPFEYYDIDVYEEMVMVESPMVIEENLTEPISETQNKLLTKNVIDLKLVFESAKKSSSKGIFIDDAFKADSKNLQLMKTFIEQGGFIYIGSPGQIINLSEPFIQFIESAISTGSITVMFFEKMITQPGSSLLENLDYLKEYKESENNVKLLSENLNKRLQEEKYILEEMEQNIQKN